MKTRDAKKGRRARAKFDRERARLRAQRARRARTGAMSAAVLVVATVFAFLVVRSGSSGVAWSGTPQQGETLTKLTVPKLGAGGAINYDQFRDKPLVLNFFASWCPFCIREMPDFEQVHKALGDKVGFLGIAQNDSAGAATKLMGQTGITYPAGIDASGVFYAATGSTGMPTTLF